MSEKCSCFVHFYRAQQIGASDIRCMWASKHMHVLTEFRYLTSGQEKKRLGYL